MLKGEGDVVTGWKNKVQTAIANITPSDMLAERHRRAGRALRRKSEEGRGYRLPTAPRNRNAG